jgi:hypothetical protein
MVGQLLAWRVQYQCNCITFYVAQLTLYTNPITAMVSFPANTTATCHIHDPRMHSMHYMPAITTHQNSAQGNITIIALQYCDAPTYHDESVVQFFERHRERR